MAYSDMSFKPIAIADAHVHITAPVSVDESARIFSEIMEYFGYARIGTSAVTTECGQ